MSTKKQESFQCLNCGSTDIDVRLVTGALRILDGEQRLPIDVILSCQNCGSFESYKAEKN